MSRNISRLHEISAVVKPKCSDVTWYIVVDIECADTICFHAVSLFCGRPVKWFNLHVGCN